MGDFELFTNPHVRNYFELKRSDQYKKALAELQIACDQGDGQAFYIMGQIKKDDDYYRYSALAGCPWGALEYALINIIGFKAGHCKKAFETGDDFVQGLCYLYGYANINKNRELAFYSIRKACKQNNPFAIDVIVLQFQDDIGYQEYMYWVKHGAELGIPRCLYRMGECHKYYAKEHVEYHLKAHLQNYRPSSETIARCYYYGGNELCKQDKRKGIKIVIRAGYREGIIHRWLEETINLQELFVFGRELSRHENVRIALDRRQYNITVNPIRIYQESIDKAQKAVFCFVLCSKSFLVKDIRQMIGKMIWKFRKDPEIWEIKI
jgi:hypothetical protein